MIILPKIQSKTFGILGLGKTGKATAVSLILSGAKVFVIDDKIIDVISIKKGLSQQYQLTDSLLKNLQIFNDQDSFIKIFRSLDAFIVSPGIPLKHPEPHPLIIVAKESRVPILSDMDLLFKNFDDAFYIGITGTNGKSTVTSLAHHILINSNKNSNMGGNIGTAVLALNNPKKDSIYTLEISSYQLDLLEEFKFNIAVLLNISPDHIDRHGNYENYIKAKKKIFLNQDKNCYAIISVDYIETKNIYDELIDRGDQNIIPISRQKVLSNGVSIIDGKIIDNVFNAKRNYPIADLPSSLLGVHNAENIAAAFVIASIFKIPYDHFIASIKTYKGLPHRMELVLERKLDKVKFINDSKATNQASTKYALLSFLNIHWIAGGLSKEESFVDLVKFTYKHIKHAYLIGQDREKIAEALKIYDVPYTYSNTLEDATKTASRNAISGDTVLLAPACASFDQWKNFEERGAQFKKIALNANI